MTPSRIAGALIAGGKSTRFGQDKAFLQYQGQTLAARLLSAMRQAGLSPLIFNGAKAPGDIGADVQLVQDKEPGLGPLGGLATVLDVVQGPVLVAACDMPGLDVHAFQSLASAYVPGRGGLVASDASGLHPLFAIYDASLIPVIREALSSGERAMHRLISKQGIPSLALARAQWLLNVNTAMEWERWKNDGSHNL